MASILRLGASVAVALALLPAGATVGATGSGLYGTVRKGPVRPVCSASEPCDAPAQVTLSFTRTFRSDGGGAITYATVRSDKQGRYRIALSPGYYQVRSTAKIGMTRLPKPHAIHVRAGRWDKIDLFFDTGIR
jgi:hypothetical protein